MSIQHHVPHLPEESKTETNYPALIVRFFWVIFGVAALAMSALYIAQDSTSMFSPVDLVYWSITGLMIGARYLDIVRYHGLTSEGNRPATREDWVRYTRSTLLISGLIWIGAHGIAYLLA